MIGVPTSTALSNPVITPAENVFHPVNMFIAKLLLYIQDEEDANIRGDNSPQDLIKLKEHKRYLDKEKVRILNDYIFPSMATLVFFFKCIASYPELRSIFENDIKDLLGIRRLNPQPGNYGFVIFNLLHAILLVGEGLYRDTRGRNKDFRLRLNQLLQEIVWAKFDVSLSDVFRNSSAQSSVTEDFNKVWGWTRMLTEGLEDFAEDKRPPHRTIEFEVEHLKEDWDRPAPPWRKLKRNETRIGLSDFE